MAAVRQGGRWLHQQPSEEEVREWFEKQPLHEGMEHDPYVGGIVLIGATEKVKQTFQKQNGDHYVKEVEQAVHVPYVKVDTRISYFWDLVRKMNERAEEEKYVGVIEPVPQKRITELQNPYYNDMLPEGFSVLAVKYGDGGQRTSRYISATWRVAIYERESYDQRIKGKEPRPVLQGIGTKQTPLIRNFPDDSAMMKAETGAIGRALGVAGILVVGTGVATAEDVQEAQSTAPGASGAATPTGPEAAQLPQGEEGDPVAADAPSADAPESGAPQEPVSPQEEDEAMRERAKELQSELQSDFPEVWATYIEWWKGRFNESTLSQIDGPALKGAVVKLERTLDDAKQAQAARTQ
jgi:hypothetical protein